MFHTTENQIGDSGAESISRALQSNTSLKSLDISSVRCFMLMFHTTGNQIGDSGSESILRALQSNTSLKFSSVAELKWNLYKPRF